MIACRCYVCGKNVLACQKACRHCGCSRVISEAHEIVETAAIAEKAGIRSMILVHLLAGAVSLPKE